MSSGLNMEKKPCKARKRNTCKMHDLFKALSLHFVTWHFLSVPVQGQESFPTDLPVLWERLWMLSASVAGCSSDGPCQPLQPPRDAASALHGFPQPALPALGRGCCCQVVPKQLFRARHLPRRTAVIYYCCAFYLISLFFFLLFFLKFHSHLTV